MKEKEEHLNLKKKGNTEIIRYLKCPIVNLTWSQWRALLTDMRHCLRLQCRPLLSLEMQVHLPHSTQNERERP